MLEWMHDESVVRDLQANFAAKTIEDCIAFIASAQDQSKNMHLAIVDDKDEYLGTVSLRDIREESSEFAITIRKSAMGRGISKWGMREILQIAFHELGLQKVFWCVDPVNQRAVRFYDKNGYKRVESGHLPIDTEYYSEEQIQKYIWYLETE